MPPKLDTKQQLTPEQEKSKLQRDLHSQGHNKLKKGKPQEALNLFKQASELGHGASSYMVATMYHDGINIPDISNNIKIDRHQAKKYFEEARRQSYSKGLFGLIYFYKENPNFPQAKAYYDAYLEKGKKCAMTLSYLAKEKEEEYEKTPKDSPERARLYQEFLDYFEQSLDIYKKDESTQKYFGKSLDLYKIEKETKPILVQHYYTYIEAHFNYAKALFFKPNPTYGEFLKAIVIFKRVSQAEPDASNPDIAVLIRQARIHIAIANFEGKGVKKDFAKGMAELIAVKQNLEEEIQLLFLKESVKNLEHDEELKKIQAYIDIFKKEEEAEVKQKKEEDRLARVEAEKQKQLAIKLEKAAEEKAAEDAEIEAKKPPVRIIIRENTPNNKMPEYLMVAALLFGRKIDQDAENSAVFGNEQIDNSEIAGFGFDQLHKKDQKFLKKILRNMLFKQHSGDIQKLKSSLQNLSKELYGKINSEPENKAEIINNFAQQFNLQKLPNQNPEGKSGSNNIPKKLQDLCVEAQLLEICGDQEKALVKYREAWDELKKNARNSERDQQTRFIENHLKYSIYQNIRHLLKAKNIDEARIYKQEMQRELRITLNDLGLAYFLKSVHHDENYLESKKYFELALIAGSDNAANNLRAIENLDAEPGTRLVISGKLIKTQETVQQEEARKLADQEKQKAKFETLRTKHKEQREERKEEVLERMKQENKEKSEKRQQQKAEEERLKAEERDRAKKDRRKEKEQKSKDQRRQEAVAKILKERQEAEEKAADAKRKKEEDWQKRQLDNQKRKESALKERNKPSLKNAPKTAAKAPKPYLSKTPTTISFQDEIAHYQSQMENYQRALINFVITQERQRQEYIQVLEAFGRFYLEGRDLKIMHPRLRQYEEIKCLQLCNLPIGHGSPALFNLAKAYKSNTSVKKDIGAAIECYEMAASLGSIEAQFKLEELANESALWKKLPVNNSERSYQGQKAQYQAQQRVAQMKQELKKVKDPEIKTEPNVNLVPKIQVNLESQRAYKKEAEQKDHEIKVAPDANLKPKIEADLKNPREYLEENPIIAEAKSYNEIGLFYYYNEPTPGNIFEAACHFAKAGESGYAEAQFYYGMMCYEGKINNVEIQPNVFQHNYNEAVRCFRLAAEQGYADAQYMLGLMLHEGQLSNLAATPQLAAALNINESVKWLQSAVAQNHPQAQYLLGIIFLEGKFGDINGQPNYDEAGKWLKLAADQGHCEAKYQFAVLNLEGKIDGKPNYQEAIRYFYQSSWQGKANSHLNLALMCYGGIGMKQDFVEAGKSLQRSGYDLPENLQKVIAAKQNANQEFNSLNFTNSLDLFQKVIAEHNLANPENSKGLNGLCNKVLVNLISDICQQYQKRLSTPDPRLEEILRILPQEKDATQPSSKISEPSLNKLVANQTETKR